MNKLKASLAEGVGALSVIRERPLLFIVLAVTLFAGSLIGANALIEPPSIDLEIRTDIIDLDTEAEDSASLIRPAPLDAESLKNAIPSEDSSNAAGLDDLVIIEGEQDGVFVIRLVGSATLHVDDAVQDRLQPFVEDQNRRRAKQKAEVALWIERRRKAWQTRIDEAKAAITQNSFDPALSRPDEGLESAKLLQLMIDATMEGQRKLRTIDAPGDRRSLAADTGRLTRILSELKSGYRAQYAFGAALKEAEAGLAEHIEETVELMREGGVLDRPAATILTPTATPPQQHLWGGAALLILLPVTAAASLIFALIGTWLVCRLRPPIEVALNDHLNDPHWPLPPNAQRELSI